jgi:hypothetical protein
MKKATDIKKIIEQIKFNKKFLMIFPIIIAILLIGIIFGGAGIKTICFFLLLELIIIVIAVSTSYFVLKIDSIKYYLYNSLNQFILGLHICAGLVVLGVYFTAY